MEEGLRKGEEDATQQPEEWFTDGAGDFDDEISGADSETEEQDAQAEAVQTEEPVRDGLPNEGQEHAAVAAFESGSGKPLESLSVRYASSEMQRLMGMYRRIKQEAEAAQVQVQAQTQAGQQEERASSVLVGAPAAAGEDEGALFV